MAVSSANLYVSLYYIFFFFLMIRRPPRSTLFPTRRSSDLPRALEVAGSNPAGPIAIVEYIYIQQRSEEHTSELQSRLHLVCRLLLEKKKYTMTKYICTYN